MQSGRESKRVPPKSLETAAKRTTIILEKEEREYVDSLISSGKEAGIKPLISKLLEIYRNLMVCDWRFPGEYYCGISRTAFLNVELLNLLIHQIPREKWREISTKMGAALKVCIETTLDVSAVTRANWDAVFYRLRVQGFGEFYTKDRYLLVKTPFIGEPEIMAGMLEGLLNVELDLKNTVPPLVFEIRRDLVATTVR